MPTIISGTTGISGTDGTAATPAVQGTDTNTGMFFQAADTIAFAEGGTEVMRIDSSGNVGVGTTLTAAKLMVVAPSNQPSIIGFEGNSQSVYPPFDSFGGSIGYNFSSGGAEVDLWNNWSSAGSTQGGFFFRKRLSGSTNQPLLFVRGDGLFQFNSGYGSVATAFGCRAWVNFNGTGTVAIRGSGNVSSVTDNGVSDYTVNFTVAMPDVNFAASLICSNNQDMSGYGFLGQGSFRTTSSYRFTCLFDGGGTAIDRAVVNVAIFR